MKNFLCLSVFVIVVLTVYTGCGSSNRSKEVASYKYEAAEKGKLNEAIQKKVGSWIQEGMTCYGIVILTDADGVAKKVKEVKSKVVSIQKDKIKMKVLEGVTLAPVEGCNKLGMKTGETWDEKEGDLFQTRDEAIKFIDTNFPELRVVEK